jgi:hypothetical protein
MATFMAVQWRRKRPDVTPSNSHFEAEHSQSGKI